MREGGGAYLRDTMIHVWEPDFFEPYVIKSCLLLISRT